MKIDITDKEYTLISIALTILYDQMAKDKSPLKTDVMKLSQKLNDSTKSHT